MLLALILQANDEISREVAFSSNQKFKVIIYPKDGDKIIGQYHQWIVHIEDHKGNLVEDARIQISGGMMDHGHGLPTKPQVTGYLGNGNYLVEGMLFNMSGNWILKYFIQTPKLSDTVLFDFELAY